VKENNSTFRGFSLSSIAVPAGATFVMLDRGTGRGNKACSLPVR
jgi:hypothetical protein